MKKYEMLYIIDSTIADDAKTAIIEKFASVVTSMGGSIVSTDKWGVKKLAYPINYKNEGFYVLMSFESEGNVISELDRVAGITDGILRNVITKIN